MSKKEWWMQPGAEILPYHVYHRIETKESDLVPGLTIDVRGEGKMVCPRCGTERAGIPHNETVTCQKCGLVMSRSGNALHISGVINHDSTI